MNTNSQQSGASPRSFGVVFMVFFIIIGTWPWLFSDGNLRTWSLYLALAFGILALIKPNLLQPLNLVWIKFGELLGRVITPIVMALLFVIAFVPIGLLLRLFGKDLLSLKRSNTKTYWITRQNPTPGTMRRQF